MPVVTAYATEESLGVYMLVTLGHVAETLNWRTPQAFAEPVQETLFEYGIADITGVTGFDNLRRLRALARVAAWRAAVSNLAAMHDYAQPGGGSASKDQLYRHAKDMLADAERQAQTFGSDYAVAIDPVTYIHDPYSAIVDSMRVLP